MIHFLIFNLICCRYVQKDKSNGPEGLTLYYELAERGLQATTSTSFKECITQVTFYSDVIPFYIHTFLVKKPLLLD